MKFGGAAAATWAPIASGLVVLAVAVAVLSPQPAGVFWDDGVYMVSARSLAAGDGYRLAHLPGAPPAVHFPPGWPAVLALLWAVAPDFPANMVWFSLLNPLLAAVAAALACAYGMRTLGLHPAVAAGTSTAFAAMLPALVLAGVLFAEPLFLCTFVVALFAADRATLRGGVRDAALAGAAAAIAALVRSTGLVLVPALACALLLARRRREAIVAVVTAVAVLLPWQAWSAAHAGEIADPLRGSYGPYLPWIADAVRERGAYFVAAIARQNVTALERSLAILFFPVGVREVRSLLVALLAVVGVLGAASAWRQSRTFVLSLVAYGTLVAVWPYAPDRFAWGIWPLVGLVIAAGMSAAWRIARRRGAPVGERGAAGVLVAITCLAVAGGAFYTARGVSRGWADVAQRRNAARLAPVVAWVRAATPPDAVVACDGEPLVHLYTGRRVVPVHILTADEYLAGTPLQQAADDLRRLLRAGGADFAVLSAGSGEIDAAALLRDGPDFPRLIPIATLPGGGVAFRVERGP